VNRTLFFLAEYAGQRRDGIDAVAPRLRLESKLHVFGAELNRWKLEKISREYELQVREPVKPSSMRMELTDLNPTERTFIPSDPASYEFLIGNIEREGRIGERGEYTRVCRTERRRSWILSVMSAGAHEP
jgi:hypothetical protein